MSLSVNYPTTRPSLTLDFINTQALDPRITFTRATSATYFDAAGVLRSAPAGQARFDYNPSTLTPLGLLIEEQRTNSIRNNTMQGAVAGTPGTDPTFWAVVSTGSGITREIVGTGVEDGITYVDYRYSGTPSAGTAAAISFEQVNQIAASSGQTWTESVYLKLQAGSFSGTSTTLSLLATNGTSGTENLQSSTITSTPTSLKNSRLSVTGTLSSGLGTTHVQPRVRIGYTVGTPFDITLRIGLPQLELGAFATSVIPTETVAVTRNADAASMTGVNFSSWYNAGSGTIYAESSRYVAGISNAQCVVCEFGVNASNNDNLIQLGSQFNTTNFQFLVNANNVGQCAIVEAGTTSLSKYVAAYEINNFAYTKNGATVSTDTLGIVPVVNQFNIGSRPAFGNTGFLNGHIRKLAYYPFRLTNAQLQALTS